MHERLESQSHRRHTAVGRFGRRPTSHSADRAVSNVAQLIDAISRYVDRRNKNPKSFTGTATVQKILKKV